MKLLNRLTLKNIKSNKKITIVIIIGIILATFLLTSVITIVSSFQKSLLEYNKKISGDYHYEFLSVPMAEVENIVNNSNVAEYFYTKSLGNTSLKSIIDSDASLELIGASNETLEKLGIELKEGRIPQNNSEIVISNKLKKYQSSELKIGNQINLENNKSYTIVGTINITDTYMEPEESNSTDATSFKAITTIADKDFSMEDKVNVYIKLNDLKNRIETIAQIVGIDDETLKELTVPNKAVTEMKLQENETNKYYYIINNNLIVMETGDTVDETTTMIYAVAGIILFIIILTSVYCIRNSFDISITEKIKQYGILASIGATKKQIHKTVYKEAFLLGIIAIPIGIITGLLFVYYFLKILGDYLSENLFGMKFIFSTNIIAILLIVFFGCLILYFSARKSAKKAAKVSPIEAIRNNQSIMTKPNKLKTSRMIKKLFGIGGEISYKNIKRNKKRYRTTVVSIIISVTLFITAVSFTKYAKQVSKVYLEQGQYNIFMNSNDYNKLEEMVQDREINQNRYEIYRGDFIEITGVEEHCTEEFKKMNDEIMTSIVSLGDQEYKRYLDLLGLNYDDAKNKAILIDTSMQQIEQDGKITYQQINFLDYKEGDKISFYNYNNEQIEELEIIKITTEEPMVLNSGPHAYFIVSDEYMNKMNIFSHCYLYIQTEDDIELEKYIQNNYSDAYRTLGNNTQIMREQQAMWTAISVFLYGFIIVTALIGITNIFNTITTSMQLRQREFACLRAIGMTKKEFNRMIRLESMFYGVKALFWGILLGLLFSYLVYMAFSINVELSFIVPIDGIVISIIAVGLLLGSIMKYSLSKINKKNIIETIRQENI